MTEEEIEAAINDLQSQINQGYDILTSDFQREVLTILRELLKLHHNHYHTPDGIKHRA